MLTVALTGGIGSGKSTVARILTRKGIPVLRADDVSKKISVTDQGARRAIRRLFGENAYTASGRLDRSYIAAAVFQDPSKRRALERILHPRVRKYIMRWFAAQRRRRVDVAVVEAALVFESRLDKAVDIVVVVDATMRDRVSRVIRRDGVTAESVKRRIAAQMSDARRRSKADIVIRNDGTVAALARKMRYAASLLRAIGKTL